ncbi:hypothetical protein O3M35_003213 [Rhynocoris fuscipes]|uniref:Uncharacterized protein n=1 Tax=Rhynocoris fuscipes TaxID=488301 RepID=A0AAW1CI80_9HEMI
MLAALFLISIVSSTFAGYFPRTPRYYNWLNQLGEFIQPNLPGVIGDEKYPQQYPEMGDDFGPDTYEFLQFVQDYDPLDHYPYVKDPYEGYGPQGYYEQQEAKFIPLLGRTGLINPRVH